jgi:hypothetical protein
MPKVPEGVQREARKGLEWRKEFGRGGTDVGIASARKLVSGNVSDNHVRKVAKYFPRHEVDKQAEGWRPGEDGYPSNGRIAWALWGGDAGWRWSKKEVARLNREQEERANVLNMVKGFKYFVRFYNY